LGAEADGAGIQAHQWAGSREEEFSRGLRKQGEAKGKNPQPMGMRWPVERTNAWLAAYGQLRRNTDRKTVHRLAQFALAVAFMLTAKLIDYRNRWSRILAPIR
jgi:hypothetical protein